MELLGFIAGVCIMQFVFFSASFLFHKNYKYPFLKVLGISLVPFLPILVSFFMGMSNNLQERTPKWVKIATDWLYEER